MREKRLWHLPQDGQGREGQGDVTGSGTLCSLLAFWRLQVFRQVLMNTSRGERKILTALSLRHYTQFKQFEPFQYSWQSPAVTVLLLTVRTQTTFGSEVCHVTNCLTNQINPWGGLLFKSDSYQVSEKFPALTLAEGTMKCSIQPATCSHTKSD
jgi:hypothetical protein